MNMSEQTICSVQFNICVPKTDVLSPGSASIDVVSVSDSAVNFSASIKTTLVVPPPTRVSPNIQSGSHTDIGPRKSNEDEHIRIDDLSLHLGPLYKWPLPSSFYAIFDGHGGSEAATYIKTHALKIFFQDSDLPQSPPQNTITETFLKDLEHSHSKAFLLADQAIADECTVSDYTGTTALTVFIIGNHLVIANAGDCRAVMCRNGIAIPISQDHRATCVKERKRVEELGGFFEDGYLNGELAVTRALGDWYMKLPTGSNSPLIAKPEVSQLVLSEDDEFMIIGCDGIWDVMSNQQAVGLVRQELRAHNDPEICAKKLVDYALKLETGDNLTAIVVCFRRVEPTRPRFRCNGLSEEAKSRLRCMFNK